MRKQSTIDLINKMPVVYYDTDSAEDGIFFYIITVSDNEHNRNIIKQLGYTDEQINTFGCHRDNEIDLSCFVWSHAEWFNTKKFGLWV